MGQDRFIEGKLNKAILIISLFILWLLAVQLLTADRYLAVANVVKEEGKVGINPLGYNLDFGDLSRNTSAKRLIKLNNRGRFRVFIAGFRLGEISELMEVNKNFFILLPGQSEEIEYTIKIPPSAPIKLYKGYAIIVKIPLL